jgi:hypothetical protein
VVPSQLTVESFKGYPPKAEKLAVNRVVLLQQLPLGFAPFLLKEVISYDWKFPVEQLELDRQLAYLEALSSAQRQQEMAVFAKLRLSPQLESFDWVNKPGQFLEILSAHLWSTHQMDAFRAASVEYVHKFYASLPQEPLPTHRLGIVVIGQGVADNKFRLFRKLRRQGVYFNHVDPEGGWQTILTAVGARAKAHPVPYAHWYIDGGAAAPAPHDPLTCVSYQSLAPARSMLAEKMRAGFESPAFSAEALRTALAQITPEQLGMAASGADTVLDRFQVSLLTEGSGTQVFSTTFVQWAAREALRRAQPLTVLTRYTPRLREQPMNELLAGVHSTATDPHGSLIDADMGAYYTWLNQQRLSGADKASFLVWFEGHNEAVAIGPSLSRGTADNHPITLSGLLSKVA